jgi:hypothetical protein
MIWVDFNQLQLLSPSVHCYYRLQMKCLHRGKLAKKAECRRQLQMPPTLNVVCTIVSNSLSRIIQSFEPEHPSSQTILVYTPEYYQHTQKAIV